MGTVDDVTRAYVECALWASTDRPEQGGEPLDVNYGPDDIDPGTLKAMKDDCANFLALIGLEGIDRSGWTNEQLGHDLWLTRNRHGAGFWDRGQGDVGDVLTRNAHAYGECDLYVGDDGHIHAA